MDHAPSVSLKDQENVKEALATGWKMTSQESKASSRNMKIPSGFSMKAIPLGSSDVSTDEGPERARGKDVERDQKVEGPFDFADVEKAMAIIVVTMPEPPKRQHGLPIIRQ